MFFASSAEGRGYGGDLQKGGMEKLDRPIAAGVLARYSREHFKGEIKGGTFTSQLSRSSLCSPRTGAMNSTPPALLLQLEAPPRRISRHELH